MQESDTRQQSATTRTRKPRTTREETREQLLDAAIDLLRRDGVSAVSTVSVTNAIGLAQSGFYQHFSSVEECLEAAAQQCTLQLRKFVVDHLEATQQETEDPLAAHVRHYQAMLDVCVNDHVVGELFLRRRFDESPVGRAMQDFHKALRDDLASNLRSIARALDPRFGRDSRIPFLADFLLAMTMTAAERLRDDSSNDSQQLADELAAYTFAMCENLWQRIDGTSDSS